MVLVSLLADVIKRDKPMKILDFFFKKLKHQGLCWAYFVANDKYYYRLFSSKPVVIDT